VSVVTYPDKGAWLEARRKVLTATQAAIIFATHCGEKVWKGSTQWHVWQEKIDGAEHIEESVAMWHGKALERPICQWVADQIGGELLYPEPYTMVYRDDLPIVACTPDAWVRMPDGELRLIESKTSSYADEWGPTGSVEVPFNYMAQVGWQQAACEVETAHLGCYLAWATDGYVQPKMHRDLRHYTLKRISAVEQVMLGVCVRWWQTYVETGFPPPRENKIRRVA